MLVSLPNDGLKPAFITLCEWTERASLDKIKLKWSRIPDAITNRCQLASSRFGYETLNTCLDGTSGHGI